MKNIFLPLLLLFSGACFADCAPGTVQEELSRADFTIIGSVTETEEIGDKPHNKEIKAKVIVEAILKNTAKNSFYVGKEVEMDLGNSGIMGVRFEGLGAYVLSGWQYEEEDKEIYQATSCMLSGRISR